MALGGGFESHHSCVAPAAAALQGEWRWAPTPKVERDPESAGVAHQEGLHNLLPWDRQVGTVFPVAEFDVLRDLRWEGKRQEGVAEPPRTAEGQRNGDRQLRPTSGLCGKRTSLFPPGYQPWDQCWAWASCRPTARAMQRQSRRDLWDAMLPSGASIFTVESGRGGRRKRAQVSFPGGSKEATFFVYGSVSS